VRTQDDLDEVDTSKERAVQTLLHVGLLSLPMRRGLLDPVIEQADDEIVFPSER
jgi:hypothetical protein